MLRHIPGKMRMVLSLGEICPTHMLLLLARFCIWYQTQDQIYYFLFVVFPSVTNNSKAWDVMSVECKCQYLEDTKDKGLMFQSSKDLFVYCHSDEYFAVLWVY